MKTPPAYACFKEIKERRELFFFKIRIKRIWHFSMSRFFFFFVRKGCSTLCSICGAASIPCQCAWENWKKKLAYMRRVRQAPCVIWVTRGLILSARSFKKKKKTETKIENGIRVTDDWNCQTRDNILALCFCVYFFHSKTSRKHCSLFRGLLSWVAKKQKWTSHAFDRARPSIWYQR